MLTVAVTAWFIVLVVVFLLAFNLSRMVNDHPNDGLGDVVVELIIKYPMLTHLGGIVVGHLWWAQ